MVFKVLAVLAVLFIVYILFFKKRRESEIGKKKTKREEAISDIMEECPTCKTYVSKKEAILSNGKYYCSKECLQ
ncbi:PP0621 family protein [Arcobacter sp.]|uniref:PP0621 family protein n=1 Tax=Arcobacter sp. TaxID=1872629 RepID=UPI003C77B0D6